MTNNELRAKLKDALDKAEEYHNLMVMAQNQLTMAMRKIEEMKEDNNAVVLLYRKSQERNVNLRDAIERALRNG